MVTTTRAGRRDVGVFMSNLLWRDACGTGGPTRALVHASGDHSATAPVIGASAVLPIFRMEGAYIWQCAATDLPRHHRKDRLPAARRAARRWLGGEDLACHRAR